MGSPPSPEILWRLSSTAQQLRAAFGQNAEITLRANGGLRLEYSEGAIRTSAEIDLKIPRNPPPGAAAGPYLSILYRSGSLIGEARFAIDARGHFDPSKPHIIPETAVDTHRVDEHKALAIRIAKGVTQDRSLVPVNPVPQPSHERQRGTRRTTGLFSPLSSA